MYLALYTTITLEGLMDHLDGIAVAESWADAAHLNAEAERRRKERS